MSSRKTKVINPPIQEPQNQPQNQPTTQQDNNEEDDIKIQAPKKKRVVSEKTLEALKKGREALNKKWQEDKIKNKELEEKYAIKKANKIIKQKMNIKKKYDVDENDTEEEEPIVIKQEKKPKKKQIIMMAPESDSEEEIIYKKASKPKQPPKPQPPAPAPAGRIFFF
jgi:hypothetical protein